MYYLSHIFYQKGECIYDAIGGIIKVTSINNSVSLTVDNPNGFIGFIFHDNAVIYSMVRYGSTNDIITSKVTASTYFDNKITFISSNGKCIISTTESNNIRTAYVVESSIMTL